MPARRCRVADTDFILTPLGDLVRAADGKSVQSDLGHTSQSSPIASDGLAFFGDSEISAVRLDSAFKGEPVWSGSVPGEVFGSPLLHDGMLFIVTGDGEFMVFHARGKGALDPLSDPRKHFEDTESGGVTAFASLTLAGRYLFLNSNSGETVILEATPQARLIGRYKLPAGSGASPVFSGKEMFLRDGDKLWCLGE